MKYLSLALVLFASQLASAQLPGWLTKLKMIQPGISTKQDAERIFDNPECVFHFIDGRGEGCAYDLADGRLVLMISNGKCDHIFRENCLINKETIIDAVFTPKN